MNDLLTPPLETDTIDPTKDYLAELVGPDKKFKSVQDLARGKYESDVFIRTKNRAFDEISTDYQKLREEYNARASLQELVDQVAKKQLQDNEYTPNVREVQMQPTIDPKQVEDIVTSKIQEAELTRIQNQNTKEVREKLLDRYGANYHLDIQKQLDDLGMSQDLFNTLAKNNPKMLYRTLGLDRPKQTENFQAPPRSSQGTFLPEGGAKRSWSHYQQLKKDNPKLWSNPKTQMQMNQDYQALGEAFEDGDYHRFNK